MKASQDAFGQQVLAFYEKRTTYELVEREDNWLVCSTNAPKYFEDFKKWPAYQRKGMNYVKGRVLDIGAGAGRVALHLQKRKIKVTAIDNSPLAIKVCKLRGVKDARVLPIEDIQKLAPTEFDAILMYGHNFGLFGSATKAKRLLKKLYSITAPDALIIAETNDPYGTSDPLHLAYHRLNRKRGRMAGQLRIRIRYQNIIGPWFDYLFVSPNEMEEILRGTGWKIQKLIKSKHSSYIAVIEKAS